MNYLVGICFGHQIIGRALGGQCVRNDRWEIGPTTLNLTDLGKTILGVDSLVRWQCHLPFKQRSNHGATEHSANA